MSDERDVPADRGNGDAWARGGDASAGTGAGRGPDAEAWAGSRDGRTDGSTPDADAWAKACAEDLAAERARRRSRYSQPPGSAGEELRKLVDAVADRLTSLQSPLFGAAAGQMARQFVRQAKAVVEPVVERNPDVFDHLAAAGSELLAAYRSAVEQQEHRWTTRQTGEGHGPGHGYGPTDGKPDGRSPDDGPDGPDGADGPDRGEGTGPGQRIDLD